MKDEWADKVATLEAELAFVHARLAEAERKATQKEVEASKLAIFQRLANLIPGAIIWREWEGQRVLFDNHYRETALGYPTQETDDYLGVSFGQSATIIHPDDRADVMDWIRNIVVDDPNRFHVHVHRLLHQNGSWRWHRQHSCLFPAVDASEKDTLLSLSIDISEEHELSEIVRGFTQHFPVEFSVMDLRTGERKATGGETRGLLGYAPHADGMSQEQYARAADLVHPEDKDAFSRFRHQRLVEKNRDQWEATIRFRHNDGSWRHIKNISKVINRDTKGDATDWVLVAMDVTSEIESHDLQKLNAALADAARMKDEFLANMSHELRTPLNSVIGFSEAMRLGTYGEVNDEQIGILKSIDQSGRHLLTLINDIMDLAKVESGKLILNLERVDLEMLCLDSLQFVRQQAWEKQLRIMTDFDGSVRAALVDERRLKQTIINLLSNAVKFTSAGGTVILSLKGSRSDGAFFIEVEDSGIGIAPEEQTVIFESFMQVKGGLDRPNEGSGLGLALAYKFVKLHGGSISVDSEVGKGSRFTIKLPWNEVEKRDATQTIGSDESVPYRSAIIIEDSAIAAAGIGRSLAAIDIEVNHLENGDDVVGRVMQYQPDIIFLDLLLPKQSGWEILAELKKTPQTSSIPIIIVSALEQHAKGLSMGADAYLLKPVSDEEIHATVVGVANKRIAVANKEVDGEEAPLILLAEDNETTIKLFTDFLQRHSYRIMVARNGREAVALTVQERPNLLVMDIQMPVQDGLSAIRELRKMERFQELPILAVTALAMKGDREKCLAAGATAYYSKPLSLLNLQKAIQRYLMEASA